MGDATMHGSTPQGPAGPRPAVVSVLYIDDDPGISRLVQRHLERSGFRVRLAADGDAGLVLARAERFDAVALDNYMPGRDGLEVLPELLALPDPAPVIFVTAAEEPRVAVTALKEGAADYVVKDVQGAFLELLASAVRQAIAEVAMRRAKEQAERELRESRDRLERLSEQQALLLREVNHRVANSLQLISSLIELQTRRVSDPEAREVLRRAVERVEAVSRVHRRLYTSANVETVRMDQYLDGLVEELRSAVTEEEAGRSIQLRADPVAVGTDRAVALGLIVNELVINALKYAYPAGRPGEVRVSFGQLDGAGLALVVEDDGTSYPAGNAPAQGSGLGNVIVSAMARTARGTVTRDLAHQGTRFVLSLDV